TRDRGKRRRGLHPFIPSLGPVFKSNLTATVAQSGECKRLGKVGEQTLGDENPRLWVGLREGRSVLGGGGGWGVLVSMHRITWTSHSSTWQPRGRLPFPSRQKLSFALSGPASGKGVGVNEQLF
uniref:Uncharacterized protein n=1 Tax=Pongo abelii TaxID=9601 RepID=H2NUC4_PONAB